MCSLVLFYAYIAQAMVHLSTYFWGPWAARCFIVLSNEIGDVTSVSGAPSDMSELYTSSSSTDRWKDGHRHDTFWPNIFT